MKLDPTRLKQMTDTADRTDRTAADEGMGTRAAPPSACCDKLEPAVWAALSEHVFFDRIALRFKDALLRCARFEEHAPGSLIAERGAVRVSIYLVMRGRIRLELGVSRGPILVESLSSGDVLGLSWVFPFRRWAVEARAVDRVKLIALDEERLGEEVERAPELAIAFASCAVRHQRLRTWAAFLSA